jgi:hypothetical protein
MRSMRVQYLLILIAIVAIVLTACRTFVMWQRTRFYRETAGTYRSMASGFRKQAGDPKMPPDLAVDFTQTADSLERAALRYERAASQPHLPIPRDSGPDR